MSALNIQIQDFSYLNAHTSYVVISVAVGVNQKPSAMITKRLILFRENSKLCRVLDGLDIAYDIMPVMVDSFNGAALQFDELPTSEEVESAVEELRDDIAIELDDARGEALSMYEELRDEMVEGGYLKEGPTLADFGFGTGYNTVDLTPDDTTDLTTCVTTAGNPLWIRTTNPFIDNTNITVNSTFRPRALTDHENQVNKTALDHVLDHFK